jgi:hypothetical protein
LMLWQNIYICEVPKCYAVGNHSYQPHLFELLSLATYTLYTVSKLNP